MALHWNMEKVKDTALLHNTAPDKDSEPKFPKGSPEDIEGDRQWAITNQIIWATIGVDIGSITEKNYEEFYARLKIFDRMTGAGKHSKFQITLADVKRRIGLSTNVANTSRASFIKKMRTRMEQDINNHVAFERKQLAKYEELVELGAGLSTKDHEKMEELRVKHVEKYIEPWRKADAEAAEKEKQEA